MSLPIPGGVNLTGLDLSGVDFSRHDSLVGTVVRLDSALIATVAIVITVRIYTRLSILRRLWSDDVIIIFAGLSTIALSALCIRATQIGLGRHEWDLDLATVIDKNKEIVKYLFTCQALYATAVTLTKLSIVNSYIRVFPTPWFHRLMYGTAAIIVAFWVCSVFITIFQCNPVRAAWDFTLPHRACVPILKYFYVAASINIATDLILCLSPLPVCWSLGISIHERVVLCVLFGVGLFASAASAVRLAQLHELGQIDISYTSVTSLSWSVIEVCAGIFCASVPSLKPLAAKFLPRGLFTLPTQFSQRSRKPNQATDLSGRTGTLLSSDGLSRSHPQKIPDMEEHEFSR